MKRIASVYHRVAAGLLLVSGCGGPGVRAPSDAASAAPAHERARAAADQLAFVHASVVDVENALILSDQTILVHGNRIAQVAPAGSVTPPAGSRVIDASGTFVIPGLWDMHVHVAERGMASWSFPLLLTHGVTGVREMASDVDSLLYWRGRARRGEVFGPRIVGAGPQIDGVPPARPEFSLAVRTAAEGIRAVDSLAARSVDFIKVYEMLQRDVFIAIVEQAHRKGLPVAGHVPLTVDAGEASDRGMRSLEHLRNIDLACSSAGDSIRHAHAATLREGSGRPGMQLRTEIHRSRTPRVIATYDSTRCTALMHRLARNGTWVVPTLGVAAVYLADPATVRYDQQRLRFVPPALRSEWEDHVRQSALRPPALVLQQARGFDRLRRLTSLARAADVGILAGTDVAPVIPWILPGASLHDELALLVDAGMTSAEALRAATIGPARYLGATDSLGTVARGRLADLVLLDANPLEDVRNVRRIVAVVANGRYFDRQELDRLLRRVEGGVRQ